jgi:NAD(P)-dependent dehydrogenase (short-subunit alcohol dehydrogenase family)
MENIFSVKDKVIIVTGATGILGHSFINALAEEGAIIGVLGRNEEIAKQRVKDIIQNGGKAIALIADVTHEEQLVAAKNWH